MAPNPARSRPPPSRAPRTGSAGDTTPAWAVEVLRDARPPLVIDTVSTARNATGVRREFMAWLGIDVIGDVLHDLVLAVYEAVANIVDHAYTDLDGPAAVRLTAHRSPDVVLITIADDGRWRAATGEPHPGRGLPLIKRLVQNVHLTHTPTGTVMYLRTPLPPAGSTSPSP